MRKTLATGLTAAILVAGTPFSVPTVSAQVRGRDVGPGVPFLQGGGGGLGVTVRDLTRDDISNARLDQPGGVVVERVRDGSPATRAGLRSGDVIVEFDGERVRGVLHFSRLVLETPPGRTVKSTISRNGARLTLDVTPEAGSRIAGLFPEISQEIERGLRTLPRDFDFDVYLRRRMPRAPLGMTLTPLTDQLASYFGVKDGLLVSAVEAGSPAARAGIRRQPVARDRTIPI